MIDPLKKTTSIIYTIVSSTKGRLSKKPTRTRSALNSTDTFTVYRHNKGNFSQLPVRDTLSTYPSAGLKAKAFAMSFHLPEMSDQSYLTHVDSLQRRDEYKFCIKTCPSKTNSISHNNGNSSHFHQGDTVGKIRSQHPGRSQIQTNHCRETLLWIDVRLVAAGETIVYIISNYPNDSADIRAGCRVRSVRVCVCVCRGAGVARRSREEGGLLESLSDGLSTKRSRFRLRRGSGGSSGPFYLHMVFLRSCPSGHRHLSTLDSICSRFLLLVPLLLGDWTFYCSNL